jgi:hypothetical protein
MYRSKLLAAAVATVAGLTVSLLGGAPAGASATVPAGAPDTPVATRGPVGLAPA